MLQVLRLGERIFREVIQREKLGLEVMLRELRVSRVVLGEDDRKGSFRFYWQCR